jgi:hypothetical protein
MYRKQLSAQRLQWAQKDRYRFILPFCRSSISLIFLVSMGFVSWSDIFFSVHPVRNNVPSLYRELEIVPVNKHSFPSPRSTSSDEAVFRSDQEAIKEEEEHMT